MSSTRQKLLYLVLLVLAGCNFSSHHSVPLTSQQESVCPLPRSESLPVLQPVSYEEVKTQVFQPKCFKCHSGSSASGGVDLANFGSAKSWANQIRFVVINNVMPKAPSPPLSASEKDLIVAWVQAGAPNSGDGNCVGNGDSSEGAPPDDPLGEMPADSDINFEFVRERIFKFRCLSCHSAAGGNADGLNLETYFNTVREIEDIQEKVSEQSMPPRPRPPLSSIERNVILRWIELGAPQ